MTHHLLPTLLPMHNTRTRGAATVFAAVLGLTTTAFAGHQPTPENAPAPVTAATARPSQPTPAAALAALSRFRAALNAWTLTADELLAVQGCAVVIRLDGQVIGRGSVLAGAGSSADATLALAEAMREAERRSPVKLDGLDDAQRLTRLRELAQQMTISVELAGPLVFLTSDTSPEVDGEAAWMIDGVAARLGTRIEGVFPSAMMLTNAAPSETLRQAVSRASQQPELGLLDPVTLRKEHGIVLYRFAVQHAVEPAPGATGELLYRGQRLISQAAIDEPGELATFADTLADALSRSWTADSPLSGLGEQATASPRSAAAAAFAMRRYLAVRGERTPARVRERVEASITAALARVNVKDTDTAAAPAQALRILAESGRGPAAQTASLLAAAYSADRFSDDLLPAARGLIALALPEPQRAKATRAAFQDQTPGTLVNLMPWLAWAEMQTTPTDQAVPSAAALRQMRAAIWQNQLQPLDATASQQDLIGGILVPGSREPLPSWQTARIIAALCTMLGDPRLTSPDERNAEIVRLLNATRFLRQLQVDRTLLWLCGNPGATLGASRPSVFDQRTSADATSMSLLAAVELMASIDKLANAPAPASAPASK